MVQRHLKKTGVTALYIFAIGSGIKECAKSVERFSTRMNRWKAMPELNKGMYMHSAIVASQTIYVFGGWDIEK